MIVPVMVSYDRIYENTNLASEMISGEKNDFTLYTSYMKMHSTGENSLGHIYYRYLDPINLEQYLKTNCSLKLNQPNFESAAHKLSTHIMEK